MDLLERKSKKNKNKNKVKIINVARDKFILVLEELLDIEYTDSSFWTHFSKEYIKIIRSKDATPKEIVTLTEIYNILTDRAEPEDVTNYSEAEKQVTGIVDWWNDTHYKIPQYTSDQPVTGDLKVLMDFLKLPLNRTAEVFEKFGATDGNYHYIEGSLPPEKRVLLLAHADTVWDGNGPKYEYANPHIKEGKVFPSNPHSGLGADDRAGIAMLYLIAKETGHSILITNYEEVGRIGAKALVNGDKELHKHIQDNHNFFIQLDRQGATDYKCYYVGSSEFRNFINKNTFFSEPNRSSFTDICTLCETVCGVNFSVGYYNEHRAAEHLIIKEWQRVLDFLRTFLAGDLPRFDLKPENKVYQGGYGGRANSSSYDDWYEEEYGGYGSGYHGAGTRSGAANNNWDDEYDDDDADGWEEIDLANSDSDYDDGNIMKGLDDDEKKEPIPPKILKKMKAFLDRVGKGKKKYQDFNNWKVCAVRYTDKEYNDMVNITKFEDDDIVDEFVLQAYQEIGFEDWKHHDRGIWNEHTAYGIFKKVKKDKNSKKGGKGNNNRRITNRGRMSNPRRDFIDDGELNSPFNNQYPHMH